MVVGLAGLDRAARDRPSGAGEAVRRPGDPVHGRLRPDPVVGRKGETEYGIKWIPLGGYIRMIGMFPPAARTIPPARSSTGPGAWSRTPGEQRGGGRPGDEDRVFYKPWCEEGHRHVRRPGDEPPHRRRAVHDRAGRLRRPGRATPITTVARSRSAWTRRRGAEAACRTPTRAAEDPGVAAGVRPGDEGCPSTAPRSGVGQMRALIRDSTDRTVPLVVERAGEQVELEVTPGRTRSPRSSTARSSSARTASPRPSRPASSASRRREASSRSP